MRIANRWMLAAAICLGLLFAGCMTYFQWNWYIGWPGLAFAQGLVERGWPCTFLNVAFSTELSAHTYHWVTRNLVLNSVFCGVLSVSFTYVVWCAGRSILTSRGLPRFSISTLIIVMFSAAATFGLWQLVHYLPELGIKRWDIPITEVKIPHTLFAMVIVGLFCLAYSFATLAFAAVSRLQKVASPTEVERNERLETPD